MSRAFCILIVVVAFGLSGCQKKTTAKSNPTPQFDTAAAPGSAADVMAHTAARFGIPVYPGAAADTSHFSMADNVAQTNPRAYLMYMTPDSLDAVVDFYRSHLNMEAADFQGTKQLKGFTPSGAQLTINVGRDNSSNLTRFVIIAFMSQTGTGMMSPVAAYPSRVSPTPLRENAASQNYNQDQGSGDDTWTFSTDSGEDQPAADDPIPQPPDDIPPSDVNPSDEDPGQINPSPPEDTGEGDESGNSNPPGDPF